MESFTFAHLAVVRPGTSMHSMPEIARYVGAPRRIVGLSLCLSVTMQSHWRIMVSCTLVSMQCARRMARYFGNKPTLTFLKKDNLYSSQWLMASSIAVQQALFTP